ncbi:cytochrome b [Shewanella sp. Choline-02u-19]|uniref:cytochrome b n=1 Tax=unclassified Shewanella TaxID=196818 RepID=UPI000C34281D|nr:MULTISPECIES: cytochrome b [unclassified Shewanella]PKG76400.1 cytochrome b [Shewanella sp. GutCb]PKH57521.1 cytochrome b [Shewanella sp. Bg11-22]PKI28383.1 cytochrome b [Shewanella sp. Choline-02u-19]
MLLNTKKSYGLVAILFHWLSALAVIGLFAVGFWMVDLTYYSEWYKTAPYLHKSVGLILLLLTLSRIFWRMFTPNPKSLASHKRWERSAGHITHGVLYLLLLVIMVSGFLISTADDRGIWVFNWFEIPSLGVFMEDQADIAGVIHQYAAYSLIGLVLIHALGALKHHFIDKDSTLLRIIKIKND